MRGSLSLVAIAVTLMVACKQKPASPDAGMSARAAPVDSAVNPGATMAQTPPPDSAPLAAAGSIATPASVSPARTDPAASDTAKKKPSTTSRVIPAAPGKTSTAAAPAPVSAPPETASQTASGELRDQYHTAPRDTVDAKTYQGWKYYNLNCARCHGEDVLGTTIAPHLVASLKPDGAVPTEEIFAKTVCDGRVEKGMPAWCQAGMTREEIDTIYAYVKGRSDAKIHPGRPARKEN